MRYPVVTGDILAVVILQDNWKADSACRS